MKRMNQILKHELFKAKLAEIEKEEAGRGFCRHDMGHSLDVARIARIISGEEGIPVDIEWIYAAALLHDIGRKSQYDDGTPHEIASAEIAPVILRDCGFTDNEISVIIEAILWHRNSNAANEKNLKGLLYRADKASRPCFTCHVVKECGWKGSKKNMKISY